MHSDGCWGLVFPPVEAWSGQSLRGLLRPLFCLFSLWPERESPPYPGQCTSSLGHGAGADLLAVGGDQEVNWGQGEICLLSATPLFIRLIFLTSSKIFGSEEEESNGFYCSLFCFSF